MPPSSTVAGDYLGFNPFTQATGGIEIRFTEDGGELTAMGCAFSLLQAGAFGLFAVDVRYPKVTFLYGARTVTAAFTTDGSLQGVGEFPSEPLLLKRNAMFQGSGLSAECFPN